jgi:hypothetical protein
MKTPSFLDTLEVAHDIAWQAARKISFSAEPTNHYAGILYFEIIELAGSVILLRQNSRIAGVSLIMRTALDAYVDFKNLLQAPDYWMNLDAADSGEWSKILQAASAPGNQYLAGFRTDPAFPDYRKHMKKKNKEAKAANATKLGAEERFKRVGMQNDYVGLYTTLSSDVHNNTSHLKYRHTRLKGDEFVFTLYSGEGGYGDAVLLTMAEIVLFASEDMHEHFGNGIDSVKGIRYVVDPARERASKADKSASSRRR